MNKASILAVGLGLSMTSIPMMRNDGITRRSLGPSGSPKRNQERAVKRMAQRSRMVNRMKRK